MDFLIGGLAGMATALITNPFDVVRTRMQLQGELRARGAPARPHRGVLRTLRDIVRREGWRGLQRGFAASAMFQLIGNGTRLGLYQQAERAGLLRDERNVTKLGNSLLVGGLAGALGACIGNPLLLVKSRQQAASTRRAPVRTLAALRAIQRRGGVRALWHGARAQVLRNGVGSSSQIATYTMSKDMLEASALLQHSNKYVSAFLASNLSAVVKILAMNPFDVIVTRLYNQPVDASGKGQLYRGVMECARKTAAAEGPVGFYKGLVPSYLRQAPQSVLILMFWDVLKDLQDSFSPKIEAR